MKIIIVTTMLILSATFILVIASRNRKRISQFKIMQSKNEQVQNFVFTYNSQKHLLTNTFNSEFAVQFKPFKLNINDNFVTVIQMHEIQNSTQSPVVILPFLHGQGKSKCVQQVAQAAVLQGRSVFVLPTPGIIFQIPENQELVNEYTDYRDLEFFLQKFIHSQCVLIGISGGAMKGIHFLASDSPQTKKIAKFASVWCNYDPLMPSLFTDQQQRSMGSGFEKFILNNRKHLIHNGVQEDNIQCFLETPTMQNFDFVVWCQLWQLGLEDYYQLICPTEKIPSVSCEVLILSETRDKLTGTYVPNDVCKKFDNVSIILHQGGDHLQNTIVGGGSAFSNLLCQWW